MGQPSGGAVGLVHHQGPAAIGIGSNEERKFPRQWMDWYDSGCLNNADHLVPSLHGGSLGTLQPPKSPSLGDSLGGVHLRVSELLLCFSKRKAHHSFLPEPAKKTSKEKILRS